MAIEIRCAEERDIAELGRLIQGIAAYHEALDERIRYDWNQVRDSAGWLKLVLAREHHAIWVADFGGGHLVGYLWVHLRRYRDARIPPVWGYISHAFLEENWRGKSLMKQMLEQSWQWFRDKGITHVSLGVVHRNWIGSSAWYRFGFQDYSHERLLLLNKPDKPPV